MKLTQKYTIFWLPILLICSISFTRIIYTSQQVSAVLTTQQTVCKAGDTLRLQFTLNTTTKTQLFLHTSLGRILLESDTGDFVLPPYVSKKKGTIHYTLLHRSKQLLSGELQITANTETPIQLESYIGPPSMTAGKKEYTMPVIVATDKYDNPLPDSTAIAIKHQFMDIEKEAVVYSKDMIGWQRIHAYEPSGRLLISSIVGKTASKEFSVVVFPALPEDFLIRADRKHSYADGNQITEFMTSILKDTYGNIVSDGTIVLFSIKNKKGVRLQTQGTTVHGQAIGKILHPDHQDVWKISAFVPGIARSNTIHLEYTSVLDDFKVEFTKGNREITVGPLLSFMDQLIPDGTIVVLKIIKNDQKMETKIKYSTHGKVSYMLKAGFYPPGNYALTIEALGVQKKFSQIRLQ